MSHVSNATFKRLNAHMATPVETPAERNRRASEDFRFMVLCAAKGNMGMYNLLRDTSLDKRKETP